MFSTLTPCQIIFCLVIENLLAAAYVEQPSPLHVAVEFVIRNKTFASRYLECFFVFHIFRLKNYAILYFSMADYTCLSFAPLCWDVTSQRFTSLNSSILNFASQC